LDSTGEYGRFALGAKEVQATIKKALAEGRHSLLEPEAKAVCLEYGIPTPSFKVATSATSAAAFAGEFGYPVVLKIVSPDIIHKTEVGGVVIGLSSSGEVESAYLRILEGVRSHRPDARILGILVQKMAPASTEVIVGSVNDPQFGHTILFGLGGVFVEILKDVSFRIAPLEERDAREMIREIKGYSVLGGYRGLPPADQDAIVNILLSASRLVMENPQIGQMDLNPTMVYERGALVADARMLLSD
jgi:acetyl-CoA synthetase (ADP-forming)